MICEVFTSNSVCVQILNLEGGHHGIRAARKKNDHTILMQRICEALDTGDSKPSDASYVVVIQAVLVPLGKGKGATDAVVETYAKEMMESLQNSGIRCHVDNRYDNPLRSDKGMHIPEWN